MSAVRRRHLLVAVLVLSSLVTGCRVDARSYAVGDGDRYVALGDSYTSGVGSGRYDRSDRCFRSARNYPNRVARATGADLGDVSCSGATTDHLVTEFTQAGAPPQLEALSESVDLVTVGIGANDFNLIGNVVVTCVRLSADAEPDETPCTDADRAAGGSATAQRLADLEERLGQRLAGIEERAPHARVLVVGYPEIVPPDDERCDQLPLTAGDHAWARSVLEGVNAALESAASRAGVTYVDVFEATRGHHVCADDPWVAGARPSRFGGAQWHPYPEEQDVVADLVLDELAER